MIVGIGMSGPQIVEGWYGQPFGKPLARTREYVDILRDVARSTNWRDRLGHVFAHPGWGKGRRERDSLTTAA